MITLATARSVRLLAVALVLALALALAPGARAAEFLVVAPPAGTEIFDAMVEGALAELGSRAEVRRPGEVADGSFGGSFRGVVAIGPKACDSAPRAVPADVPLALVSYQTAEQSTAPGRLVQSSVVELGDHLAVVRALLPGARRIAILCKAGATGARSEQSLPADPKGRLGLACQVFAIESWGQLRAVTSRALAWGDVVWLPSDRELTTAALAHMIKEALAAKKPVFASSSRIVKGGAVAGLAHDPQGLGRRAGAFVRDGSAGAGAAPEPPRLYVNRKVAEYLGVALPDEVASHVLVDAR